MNILENRIDSFHRNNVQWPYLNKIETFAKAGYYFMKRPKTADSVRCYLCDIEASHWKQGQSPYTRHTTDSPTCPWVLLNFPDANNKKPVSVNEKPRSAAMRNARLATFTNHSYWKNRSGKYPPATKLADAGFYYSSTLEHKAQVKCPYCHLCITNPSKNTDYLEYHQAQSDACPFFETKRTTRNTLSSSTSTETFKTASSDFDPASKKRKFNESNDDSFWDIEKTFEPAQVRKPAITFGNPSSRQKTLRSGRPDTVNIFSTIKKSSLIIKPNEKRQQTEKRPTTEQDDFTIEPQKETIPESAPLKKARASRLTTESLPKEKLTKTKPLVKKSTLKNLPIERHSLEKLPVETLVVEKPPVEKPPVELPVEKSLAEKIPTEKSTTNEPNQQNVLQTPSLKQPESDMDTPPMKRDKGKGKAVDLPRKPISLSKTIKTMSYLQSTPSRSQHTMVKASDIFGDLSLSPITGPSRQTITEPATPTIYRTSMIPLSGKARPQPPSPTRQYQKPVLIVSESESSSQAPLTLDENEKKLKVEEYLHFVINKSIEKVKSHGNQVVQKIQEKSDLIKQELLNQQQ